MKLTLGAAFIYPLLFAVGCSSNDLGAPGLGSGNSASNNGGTGSAGANQGGIGSYHVGNTGGSGTTGTGIDLDSGCAATTQPAVLTRVNIVFLLDKSGSMGNDPNGQWSNAETRWNPVVTTLRAFFQDQKSTGIYASLSYLPADGNNTAMCKVASYQTASANSSKAVALTLLDDTGRQAFLKCLCDPTAATLASTCITPAGGTPTRPALQGTIDYLTTVQQKYKDSKTVIVFLTDGEPLFGYQQGSDVNLLYSCDDLTNGCPLGPAGPTGTGTCSTADGEVQKVADVIKTAPNKSIYLFGVGDLTTATMNTWADATGNPAVALQDLSPADAATKLKTALEGIRSTSLPCNIAIPPPTSGAIDPGMVNVQYVDGTGKKVSLGKSVGCTSPQISWQFDDASNPKQIVLCPNACNQVQADPAGKVEVLFGCATIIY